MILFQQFNFLAYNQYDYVHGLLINDLNSKCIDLH